MVQDAEPAVTVRKGFFAQKRKKKTHTTNGAILQHTVPLPPVSTESTTAFDIFPLFFMEGALPDLTQVLSEPLLRHVFGVYLLSCFVPEGMAFRDDVERYMALFDKPQLSLRGLQERRAVAEEIVKRFCRSDSPHEIVLQGRTRSRLKEKLGAAVLERDLFAEALAESDTSLAACLPAFLRSDVWLLLMHHKELCERLFARRTQVTEDTVVEEVDADDVGESGCTCFGRRRGAEQERRTSAFEIEGEAETVERAELALLWRYGVAGAHVRVRRMGEEGRWLALARCSVSDTPRIQPVDPTLVVVR